jgi:hypothetical protein
MLPKPAWLFLLPLLLIGGCTKIYQASADVNPVAPTPPVVVKSALVEYRVTGTVTSATITISDTTEGSETILSNLPWFRQFKIQDATFLYLDASSFDYGQLHIQIFVDGVLFREAFVNGYSPKVAISGTYHF